MLNQRMYNIMPKNARLMCILSTIATETQWFWLFEKVEN